MAKRTRGSSRPGQRRPPNRPAPVRTATRPPVRRTEGLTPEEEARAAELEEQLVEQERAAELPRTRARERERERDREPVAAADRSLRRQGQSILAVKAAEEYAYVVRDVRRIVTVAAGMLALMAIFYVAIEVLHLITVG